MGERETPCTQKERQKRAVCSKKEAVYSRKKIVKSRKKKIYSGNYKNCSRKDIFYCQDNTGFCTGYFRI